MRASIIDSPEIGDRAKQLREAETRAMFECVCQWVIDVSGHLVPMRVAACPVHGILTEENPA